MWFCRSTLALGAALWLAPMVLGQAASPAKALEDKGLTRSGLLYVLASEAEVSRATRDIRDAKARLDQEQRARHFMEDQIRRIKGAIAAMEYDAQQATRAAAAETNVSRQNQLAATVAAIRGEIAQATKAKAELDARLRSLGEQAKTAYVNLVVEASAKAEKVQEQYKAMAADPDVLAALARLNESSRLKYKLGPSAEFEQRFKELEKARSEIASAVIRLKPEGRVYMVEVTLNGKITRQMILDTGASTVSLTWDLADELGILPTDADQKIRLQLADGKVVEAWQKSLASVRVGGFIVENVECTVMPRDLIAAQSLLGGSFLNNFVYKLDPKAGELHLASVGGKAVLAPPAAADNKPATPGTTPGKTNPDDLWSPPGTGSANTSPNKPAPGATSPGGSAPGKVNPGSLWDPSDPVKPPAANTTPGAGVTPPVSPATADPRKQQSAKKILDYLEGEYKRKLSSPDWRVRGLAVISLSRLPQPEVTQRLMTLINNDRHDVVKLLAWQAMLSRVPSLTDDDHASFINATIGLAEKNAFRGRLRVTLLEVLATSPVNTRSRRIWEKIFMECNAWETQDTPVLRQLGRTLAAWHSGQLLDFVIGALGHGNLAVRADYVLQAANVPVQSARRRLPASVFDARSPDREHVSSMTLFRMVQADCAEYLRRERREWTDLRQIPGEPWRQLRPLYLPPPVSMETALADESLWHADLELGAPDMKAFEVAFVVDATGSMGDVLAWLSRDLVKMATALSTMSLEPRLGVTFYRDHGEAFVVRHGPLTSRTELLVGAINEVGADGGGDVPEAVLDGLREAIQNNRWVAKGKGSKVIVLIGDAPPHPRDVDPAIKLAGEMRNADFSLYAVKVTTSDGARDLTSFDQIAQAGGGNAINVVFPPLSHVRFIDQNKKEIPLQTIARPEAQLIVAPAPAADHPGERILMEILSDTVNPQYRDRVHPMTRTLLSYCEPISPPEQRKGFPENTPPLKETQWDSQKDGRGGMAPDAPMP